MPGNSLAPDLPIVGGMQLDVADGPAAVLPNGDVLVAARPGVFMSPVTFLEFHDGAFVETVYPLFGHYSKEKDYTDYVHFANLLSPTADGGSPLAGSTLIGKSNVSVSVSGIPALVNDYLSSSRGSTVAVPFSNRPANASPVSSSGECAGGPAAGPPACSRASVSMIEA